MTSERAFTMLELVVVLAVLAIAAGLVLPHLADVGRLRVVTAARRLADDVTVARDGAILGGRPVRIVVDVAAGTWRSEPPLVQGTLADGIRVRALSTNDPATPDTVVLSPAGDALPVRIDLADDRGHTASVVVPPGLRRVAAVELGR